MESRHRWNPGVGLSQEAEWEGGGEAELYGEFEDETLKRVWMLTPESA